MNFSVTIVFILYLAFMMAVGIYFYRRTDNLSDYILGGRGLNSWVAALSAQASDMSGWLLMGLPGAAYLAGFEAGWIAVGLGVGTYLNWRFTARRLRLYTEKCNDSLTLSDYLSNRFRDRSNLLRVVSAAFILIFFLIYTASGLVAGGRLFSTVFGLPYLGAVALGTLAIITYTFLGGFMAVSWTDFFQGTLMFIAILAVPLTAMAAMGGLGATADRITAINPELLNPFTGVDGLPVAAVVVISSLAWGLGYFGQPHILARFMAIKSAEQIRQSRLIAMIWVVISLFSAVVVGMLGRVYLGGVPLEGAAVEEVFMRMVQALFNPWVAGIMLSAILAAIMSTADSQLLVTASAISEDFYKPFFRPKASDKELVWVGRLTVVAVAAIAFVIAMNPDNKVLDLVAYAWAGFGSAFGPVILISLFWKRMTRNGALAGMLVGGVTALVWQQISGGLFDIYEIVPGFLFAAIAVVVVSLAGKEPAAEIQEEFDRIG